MTFFDSSVIPNVMSSSFCEHLHIRITETKHWITMVDSEESSVGREISKKPVTNGPLTTKLSYLLIEFSQYNKIIGGESMKIMEASQDFDKNFATFRYGEEVTKVLLVTEGFAKKDLDDK